MVFAVVRKVAPLRWCARVFGPRSTVQAVVRTSAFMVLGAAAAPSWAALGASVTLAPGAPGTIYPGGVTTFRITLSNSNPTHTIDATAFSNVLPGTLPNGLKVADAATVSYTCSGQGVSAGTAGSGTLALGTGGQSVTLSGGVIPAASGGVDGNCVIDIPVTAGTSTGNAATYSYQIAAGAVSGNDGGVQSNVGNVQQSVNVNALQKPQVQKTFSNAGQLILGGSAITVQIRLINPNSVALSGVGVTDAFPTAINPANGNAVESVIKVAATGSASVSCTLGGTPPSFISGNTPGDTAISVTGGTLAANGSCDIVVPVDAVHTAGSYSTTATNSIAAGDVVTEVGLAASAGSSAPVTVTAPLQVSKTGPPALAAGQTGTFVIVLSNSGPNPLTASFTDAPIDGVGNGTSGLQIAGPGAITGSNSLGSNLCGAVITANAPAQAFQVSGALIPAGGTCTFYVAFTGTLPTANTPHAYTNALGAGAVDVGNPAIKSQAASATVTIYDTLNISKAGPAPSNAAPGSPVRYQVTVQNWSASAMPSVVITDTLANGQTYLTGTVNAVNYSPSVSAGCGGVSSTSVSGDSNAVLTIGSVPARSNSTTPGSCTVTFWAMTSSSGTAGNVYGNQLGIGSVCYPSGGSPVCNGAASNAVSGSLASVLSVQKAFSPAGPLNEGAVTRMTITMSNLSVNPLSNVTVSDNLPLLPSGAQMRVATPANAVTTCGGSPVITATDGSTSVQMNGASVPGRAGNGTGAAGSCKLQVDVVAAAGAYTNQASVTATQTYANGATASNLVGPVTANASITFNSALCASSAPCSKRFAPAAVSTGGRSTVTVQLVNSGALALTNVGFTDSFPGGMVLAANPNAYTTCNGSTNLTAVAGAHSITLAGATIAGNGNCDLVFDVVATGSAAWTNTIAARAITADGGVANQSAISATLGYLASSAMTLAKATNPSTLTFPGQSSQLTITVNNGSVAVSNLHVTDYFTGDGTPAGSPNGMVVASVPQASTTCPNGQVSASAGATAVSLTGATLAANASCTVTVNVTATAVGGITNFLPAGSLLNDQGVTNAAQVSTSLTTQSNVGVVKQFTPAVVQPGERARLRITFYNPTPQPVVNLAMTDNLPSGLLVPAGPAVVSTCSGATVDTASGTSVQLSHASIAATSGGNTASCYIELDVAAASTGDYTNTIAASSVTGVVGGIAVSNAQPTSDTLRVKLPLVLHKAFSSLTLDSGNPSPFTTGVDSKAPGQVAVMTFLLGNPNATAVTQLSFTDILPANLVVATTPGASSTCSGASVQAAAAGTSVRLTGATLAANGSCTVTLNVLSHISGTYTDASPSGAISTAEGLTNLNGSTAQIVVSTPPTLAKQFTPSVIAPGGTSTLTLVLGNTNSTALTLSSALVDTLPTAPGNLILASNPNVQSTCNGSVTASGGGASVTLNSGATIPAGGCTLSVDVTGTTPGTYNNNLPAGSLVTSLGSNQQAANATLAISSLGFVAGKVFLDNNVVPNGTFEQGTDAPVSGVSIALVSGANCSGTLVSQNGWSNPATTDALGNYLFAGLPAGTYSVCEAALPAGTTNGQTTAGTIALAPAGTGSAGTASNPSATTSQIVNIVLGTGSAGSVSGSAGNNFAKIVPSALSGTVFLDRNNDGLQNAADSGMAAVTVNLLDGSGGQIASTTTDSSGNYRFGNLQPGSYTLSQPVLPSGTSRGITSAGTVAHGGTAGTATAPTVSPSQIQGIVLPPNTLAGGNNFAVIPNGRTVSGQVFLDHNNDGLRNGTDYGLPGLTLTLTGNDVNGNAVSRATTTDASGNYAFAALPEAGPGGYTVQGPGALSGTRNGVVTAGSSGGTASTVGATPVQIRSLSLAGGNTVSADNNFAMVPGNVPDLTLSKTHSPSSFAAGSATGYYTLTPANVGTQATGSPITITDNLPPGITLARAPAGSGWNCTGAAGDSSFRCTSTAVIGAGASGSPVQAQVAVGASLAGQILTNTAVIAGGSEPVALTGNNTASDATAIATAAGVSGHVWLDTQHNATFAGSNGLADWTVQLLLDGVLVATTTTAADGGYRFTAIAPGSGYQLRFLHAGSSTPWGAAVPNEGGLGYTSGVVAGSTDANGNRSGANPAGATVSAGTLSNLTLTAGVITQGQSLPVDPSGVVYDAISRQPVAGAVLTISGPPGFVAATHLVSGQASMTTGSDGLYQFLLNASAPAGTYTLTVTGYPAGYATVPSNLIPACSNGLRVGATPAPALIQAQATPPALSAPVPSPDSCPATTAGLSSSNQSSTQYFLRFDLSAASASVINNNIPLDPLSGNGFALTKTGDRAQAQLGDSVRYTVGVRLNANGVLPQVTVQDRLPPGFTFIAGTARLNGATLPDPQGGAGPVLAFHLGSLRGATNTGNTAPQELQLRYRVRVGVGAMQGNGINTAVAYGCSVSSGCLQGAGQQPVASSVQSNRAQFKVTVSGGVFTDQACVLGKIFVSCSNDHVQHPEDMGIPGVRLYFEDGGYVVSDSEGKYSRCGLTPRSHVLVPDRSTLPRGARLTTSSNRNLGDANSLFIDLKNGELHRADFIEGSCSNQVLEQVKARRAQGEVRSVETERQGGPALRFLSKPPGYPREGTDRADQPLVQPRQGGERAQ